MKLKLIEIETIVLLTLFTANPVSSEVLTGTVVNVIDGDTIKMTYEKNKVLPNITINGRKNRNDNNMYIWFKSDYK